MRGKSMKLKLCFSVALFAVLLSGCGINKNNANNSGNNSSGQSGALSDGTLVFEGGEVRAKDNSISGKIVIPESYEGMKITSVGSFEGCNKITSITIPDSVTKIAKGSFKGCIALEEYSAPFVGLTSDATGRNALFGMVFGNDEYTGSTKVIQNYSGASGDHTNVYIPNSLTKVKITNATTLGYGAFDDMSMLTTIELNDGIVAIGGSCFFACSAVKEISLPNITDLPSNTFAGASSLETFTINSKIRSIGTACFKNCINLSKVNSEVNGNFVIPNTVTSIKGDAFSGCIKVTSFTAPFVGESDSSTGRDGVFGIIFGGNSYTGGTGVIQHYSATAGHYSTFYIPSGLRSVSITNATRIGYGAFNNMNMLEELRINAGAQSNVGDSAFDGLSCSVTWVA